MSICAWDLIEVIGRVSMPGGVRSIACGSFPSSVCFRVVDWTNVLVCIGLAYWVVTHRASVESDNLFVGNCGLLGPRVCSSVGVSKPSK